jgi:prolyl-tRNA synthetase
LIPQSFIEREKEHVKGFAPEVAVVTHAGGKELEEPLVIRPTSETIIYSMFAKWVQSYRDLPLLINQWANVVRWEMRTRLFLRTSEFLWQEGHTAHISEAEAEEETLRMLGVYRTFMDQWMAMPPVLGRKTDSERFAGALRTYSCEAMMQDNRALQAGTSHNLGQNFARQFDLKYQTEAGGEEYAWNTSWGVSTRLIGGLIMTHGDDVGIVLPPRLAPYQVVIVPIARTPEDRTLVMEAVERVASMLRTEHVRVHIDTRENMTPGAKFYEWERKGVPLRLEIGPKDVAAGKFVVVGRMALGERPRKEIVDEAVGLVMVPERLKEIQAGMLEAAIRRREENSYRGVTDYGEFQEILEGPGGFIYTGWCGSAECEEKVKEETKATIRVLPFEEFRSATTPERCIACGGTSSEEAVWARAY